MAFKHFRDLVDRQSVVAGNYALVFDACKKRDLAACVGRERRLAPDSQDVWLDAYSAQLLHAMLSRLGLLLADYVEHRRQSNVDEQGI